MVSSVILYCCACSSGAQKMRNYVDWPRVPEVNFATVKKLADHYAALRAKDFNLNVREINLSAVILKEIASESSELRIIMGADEKNNIVLVLERKDKMNKKHRYFLKDLFNDAQDGSAGFPPLCGPEPALCPPRFPKPTAGSEVTQQTVVSMSERYYGSSNADPKKMLLQMNLPPSIITNLIAGSKNVKLIPGLSLTDGFNTLILELVTGTKIGYVDLKTRTPYPVCPPPRECALTEF